MHASRFMPCNRCGESVDSAAPAPHVCVPQRVADFRMFRLRHDVAAFEACFVAYQSTPHGRFEARLAAEQVRRTR